MGAVMTISLSILSSSSSPGRKPPWLKMKMPGGVEFAKLYNLVNDHRLHTVCQSAKCPNMGECWAAGTATLMILGDVCTRSCGFCNIATGKPQSLDLDEPYRVGDAVRLWFAVSAKNLKQSRYCGGCPVATVALETAPGSTALTAVCSTSLRHWQAILASRLRAEGVTAGRARELATMVVANLEGSLLLARVAERTEPIALAAETVASLIDTEISAASSDAP